MATNKTERIHWIDTAKFFGIFMIVYGHTIQEGFSSKYVYSFHVPLFFLLLGVVASVTRVKNKAFLPYLKSKSFTLLLPFYAFAMISTLLIFVISQFITFPESEIFLSVKKLATDILIGNCKANQPLWFLPCSFAISVMSFFIIKFAEFPKKSLIKNLIIFAAVSIPSLTLFLLNRNVSIPFMPYKIETAFFMLPFFFAGYIFMECNIFSKLKNATTSSKIIVSVLLLSAGVVTGLWNGEAGYLGNYYGNIPVFYLSALSSSLAFCIISMTIPEAKTLSYIGQSSLTILLLHKFPILAFQKVVPFTKDLLADYSSPVGVIVTIITIIFCCIAQVVIEKICPFIIGKKLKRKINKT